jgi:APA family basic amino acid/polyamine antiporter
MAEKPKKLLNMFDLFSLSIGGAIGSGIFVMLGMGIDLTGRSIVLALLAGCLVMMCAYMYTLFLSSVFVFKGGDYDQKLFLMSPIFIGVNALFTFLMSAGMAMYSVSMVNYASVIFPSIVPYTKLIAILITTLFFASTIKGAKFMATIQNIMTIVLMLSITIFIVMGIPKIQEGYFEPSGFFRGGWNGFLGAIAIMSFACQGTVGPVAVSAATRNPKVTVTRAIFLATIGLAIVYGLMSVVAAGVLPVDMVANKPLGDVAKEIFPHTVYILFILGGAVFAIATSLMGAITTLRYPLLQVAEDGWLPDFFTAKTPSGYPWVIQLTFYILTVLPIIFNFSFDFIVSLAMIPTMLICAYCNFKCMAIPQKYPNEFKASIFKMPYPLFSALMIFSVICDLFVAYKLFTMQTQSDMIMIIVVLVVSFSVAALRLKQKAVSVDTLNLRRKEIIESARQTELEINVSAQKTELEIQGG